MKLFFLLQFAVFYSISSFSQHCVGQWVTFDDVTGEKRSVVELYKKDGKLYGEVVKIFPRKGEEEFPKCEKCTGSLHNKPVVGMQIVKGLTWDGEEWEGGTILDPENGKTYTVKMWIEDGNEKKLMVRGYIGPFYRTQSWYRAAKDYRQ
ncbi:MAG: hypothetical protein RL264_2580 [Bacteroidota bacterium]|jgi:uncharacterized protein (DUF2147 family)